MFEFGPVVIDHEMPMDGEPILAGAPLGSADAHEDLHSLGTGDDVVDGPLCVVTHGPDGPLAESSGPGYFQQPSVSANGPHEVVPFRSRRPSGVAFHAPTMSPATPTDVLETTQ